MDPEALEVPPPDALVDVCPKAKVPMIRQLVVNIVFFIGLLL
jgi:hypothetical protein